MIATPKKSKILKEFEGARTNRMLNIVRITTTLCVISIYVPKQHHLTIKFVVLNYVEVVVGINC